MRPLHRQRTLRRLRRSGVRGYSIAFGGFGRHDGWGQHETEDGRGVATVSEGKNPKRRKKGGGGSEIGEDAGRGVK